MGTLTVDQARKLLKTPEGRRRLDAAVARACGYDHIRDPEYHRLGKMLWLSPCGDYRHERPPCFTAGGWPEIGMMWEALPRKKGEVWIHEDAFDQHTIGRNPWPRDEWVTAPSYRAALFLALAACEMLETDDA